MPLNAGRNGWRAGSWAVVRALLGGYVAIHLAMLLPWGTELFSSAGIVPDGSLSPLLRLFPNVLMCWDGPVAVSALLLVGVAAGIALVLGVSDRFAALVAWYVLTCLLGRNPLILNPALPHIGFTLLVLVALPAAPSVFALRRRVCWRLPQPIYVAMWVVSGASYTYSAITKLMSASWVDGTALGYLLQNPLARDGALRTFVLQFPDALTVATYAAVGIELIALPLAFFGRGRPWLWVSLLGLHLGLLALVDFTDLTLGMLVTHAFLFDPRWLSRGGIWPEAGPTCAFPETANTDRSLRNLGEPEHADHIHGWAATP